MSQIRLVADSSCDLLSLDGVDFVSVPLTLRTETEEFRDDARLDVDAMVATLRAYSIASVTPMTMGGRVKMRTVRCNSSAARPFPSFFMSRSPS